MYVLVGYGPKASCGDRHHTPRRRRVARLKIHSPASEAPPARRYECWPMGAVYQLPSRSVDTWEHVHVIVQCPPGTGTAIPRTLEPLSVDSCDEPCPVGIGTFKSSHNVTIPCHRHSTKKNKSPEEKPAHLPIPPSTTANH